MYFVTSIFEPEWPRYDHCHRCFGYYLSEKDARRSVDLNRGNAQECLYNFLVIEKIGEGIHRHAEVVQWYEWQDDKWTEIPPPKFSIGICNYAIG
jgi:hypothetical protein